jgi:hypothetical protein
MKALDAMNQNNNQKEILFSDTDHFYQELITACQSGAAVHIITHYTRYSDLPPRLKQICQLGIQKEADLNTLTISSTASITNSHTNIKAMSEMVDDNETVIRSTLWGVGVGAGIGAWIGGIGAALGAFLGAVLGLAFGIINVAFIKHNHSLQTQINSGLKLKIYVQPQVSNLGLNSEIVMSYGCY